MFRGHWWTLPSSSLQDLFYMSGMNIFMFRGLTRPRLSGLNIFFPFHDRNVGCSMLYKSTLYLLSLSFNFLCERKLRRGLMKHLKPSSAWQHRLDLKWNAFISPEYTLMMFVCFCLVACSCWKILPRSKSRKRRAKTRSESHIVFWKHIFIDLLSLELRIVKRVLAMFLKVSSQSFFRGELKSKYFRRVRWLFIDHKSKQARGCINYFYRENFSFVL